MTHNEWAKSQLSLGMNDMNQPGTQRHESVKYMAESVKKNL